MKPRIIKAITNPRRVALVVVALLVGVSILTGSMSTNQAFAKATPPTRQKLAQQILSSKGAQFMTSNARLALELIANGSSQLNLSSQTTAPNVSKIKQAVGGTTTSLTSSFANYRVNNPSEDRTFTDQTTQSETSIAVHGSHIAVGYNDSQTTGFFLTAGSSLSGYSYATYPNGILTFKDGGPLPNRPGAVNFGDPWLASDSSGVFYYSNLVDDFFNGLVVGVARSTNGGVSWTAPVEIPPPPPATSTTLFAGADKDAMIALGAGNLYDAWDDFTFDFNTGFVYSGLTVAHSTNGGHTWSTVYADRQVLFDPSNPCSFSQYIGAQPFFANGTVYVASLRLNVNDPTCTGAPMTESQWIFASSDGGQTFGAGVKIADVTPSNHGFGAFFLGTAEYMRVLEFPTLATLNGDLYATWMDGGFGDGHTHIRLAVSTNGGATWSTSFVTSGLNDEAQPSISADSKGLHILYYQISPVSCCASVLNTLVSNSTNGGATWGVRRVTRVSFPGVFTLPQFDPIIAFEYMGDYIANVAYGGHQYFAWGDNRDIVKNVMWPHGRHDPDVFFAKQ